MNKNILKEIFTEMAAIFKTKLEASQEEAPAEESTETPAEAVEETKPEATEESTEEPTETPAEEAKVEEPAVEPWKAQLDALKADNDALRSELAELKTANEQFASRKEVEEASAEFALQVKSLNDTLKLLAGLPAEFSKTNEDFNVKNEKDEKLSALMLAFHEKN